MMKEADEHYTLEELNALFELGSDAGSTVWSDRHLSLCPECRAEFLQMARIDRFLRIMPLPHLGSDFTSRVIARALPGRQATFGDRLLLQGATFLIVLVGLAFAIGGYLIIAQLPAAGPGQWSSSVVEQCLNSVGEGVRWVSGWLSGRLGGVLDGGSVSAIVTALVGGITLVVLDQVFERRFKKRFSSGG